MAYTDFNKDNAVGVTGEKIFENNYLNFFNIKFRDVSGDSRYRKADIDYIAAGNNTYEVKTNLKDLDNLFIEEYHNIWKKYGKVELGWFYKTEAKFVVFINKENGYMIFLKMGKETIDRYNAFKEKYELRQNAVSHNPRNPNPKTNKWQSAYRIIPLSEFDGLYSVYQKSVGTTPPPGPPVAIKEVVDEAVEVKNAPLISAEEREVLLNLF